MRVFRIAAVLVPVFATGAASAADLPRRTFAPTPPVAFSPAPAFSWSGFYAGVNAGYGWGSLGSAGNAFFNKPDGFVAGVTAGYNHQINQFVVGLEGDFGWAGLKSSRAVTPTDLYSSRANWMGTLRARAGFAADRALVYATAGYAGASMEHRYLNTGLGGGLQVSESWQHGWAAGVGIEYAFTHNISMKTEYLYVSLGRKTMFAPPVNAGLSASLVRVGLNYRF